MKTGVQYQLISVFALLLALALAGCEGTPTPQSIYTRITDGAIHPGDAIPVAQGAPILTVTGRIGSANSGDAIVMDLATIEAVGIVEYTVLDPFQNREITYRGPLMSDLLALWQVPDEATILDVLALNDYRADVPIDLVRDFPVIFAVQSDGEYMPIVERGPAMLVFPYDDFEFERPANDSYWVWQIKSIDIR